MCVSSEISAAEQASRLQFKAPTSARRSPKTSQRPLLNTCAARMESNLLPLTLAGAQPLQNVDEAAVSCVMHSSTTLRELAAQPLRGFSNYQTSESRVVMTLWSWPHFREMLHEKGQQRPDCQAAGAKVQRLTTSSTAPLYTTPHPDSP